MEKHHVTPVHKGRKNGPLVEVNPWDHAEIHAERFLDGRDTHFHFRFLEFLSPELSKKVRKKQGRLQDRLVEEGKHPFQKVCKQNGHNSVKKLRKSGKLDDLPKSGNESWKRPIVMFDLVSKEEIWFESLTEFKQLFNLNPRPSLIRGRPLEKRFVFRWDWEDEFVVVEKSRGRTIVVEDLETGQIIEFNQQKELSEFIGVSPSLVSSHKRLNTPVQGRFLIL